MLFPMNAPLHNPCLNASSTKACCAGQRRHFGKLLPVIGIIAVLAASPATVSAADLHWDGGAADIPGNGDGVSQGGAGTWNNTISNWDAGAGIAHVAWNSTNTAVFGGAGGVVTLGAVITNAGLLVTATNDVTITGGFGFVINGAVNLAGTNNLTLGNIDGGTVNLSDATLTGSNVLTWNKTADTYFNNFNVASFNSSNSVNFTGTLRLRGSTPSTAPGSMQGGTGRFWLHSSLGSQVTNTAFFLDTGAAPNNGQDFIIGDWNTNGNRTLTLSGLTGFGTIRTDAGTTGTRNLIVNQSVNTTFNGMILSHFNSLGTARSLVFTKDGTGSLTLAGIVGFETVATGGNITPLSVTVLNGTLVMTAANTLTGPTTVNGGSLVINGIHPATSAITVGAGGTLSGTGIINGAVTNNGTLSPGFPLGTLTIADAPVMNGTTLFQINRTNLPNTGKLVMNNTLVYGGTLTVTNIGFTNFAPGDSFVLFSASGGFSGSFTETNLPPLAADLKWVWSPNSGTLSVTNRLPPDAPVITPSLSGGNLLMPVNSQSGYTYVLQSATNLVPPVVWIGVTTNAGTGGVLNFSAPVNPAQPQSFFRVVAY